MVAHVHRIPLPQRAMCGASGYQPPECFLAAVSPSPGSDEVGWKSLMPTGYAALYRMFGEWMSSGLADEAQLGWPLTMNSGEFIAINKWKQQRTPTCVFRALFSAASAHTDARRDRCFQSRCGEPKM